MFDRTDLRAAVGANILSAEQAARFEAFLLSRKDDGASAEQIGQENLRFLGNFNDIFITLGLGILFVGVIALVGTFSAPAMASGSLMAGVLFSLPVAGFAWLLMEYFCARRRLLLPSMALSIIFVVFCSAAAMSFAASVIGADLQRLDFGDMYTTTGQLGVFVFLAALAASIAIYMRFRLPFSLALSALSAAGSVYVGVGFFGNISQVVGGPFLLLLGTATLAIAIWFDMQDPERIRKESDNAFWLHLAAAPQLIWGISALVTGSNVLGGSTSGADDAMQGITLLAVLLAIGVVSLALNRRALIAASLLTFIITLVFVLNRIGLDGFNLFIAVTMLIGTGVVLLGAGWKTARRAVLVFFPKGDTWSRVFPPEVT
ncbi:MAG: hypothetical protein AAF582_07685 [Pseudomonadota bacterium]